VTKVEVYAGTNYAYNGAYIACIVFYKGNTIIGAPIAAKECGYYNINNIKANYLDRS
jgi:hypothetical protein